MASADRVSFDGVSVGERAKLDSAVVAELYAQHAQGLRFFLLGMLRDPELAGEALQATFVKALEFGHAAEQQSLRGWLFRVAHNEAIQLRRRQSVDGRAMAKLADSKLSGSGLVVAREVTVEASDAAALRAESIEQVRAALSSLPPEQREVVRLRIHEQKKFAEIAKELSVPLGTVLSRMHAALDKLRQRFGSS